MFGDFIHHNKRIPPNEYNQIENGTPIVAFRDFAPVWQFGIYYNETVIFREYSYEMNLTHYSIVPFNHFHTNLKFTIYEYTPIYSYDKEKVIERALSVNLKQSVIGYASVFGDDFVFWCLVGDDFMGAFADLKMGMHYKERYKEMNTVSLYHHAIAIEQDIIVHFHDVNENSNKTLLSLSHFSTLKNPIVVEYENDDFLNRFQTRNRALWAWGKGDNLGGYNIATNNCEHFATWCRTGKAKSKQVRTALRDIASLVLVIFDSRLSYIPYRRCKKYFK